MPVWVVRTLRTAELVAQGLHEAIVAFDRRNMGAVLAQGAAFPEERRRKAFEVDGLFIVVLDGDQNVLGYVELCPDWDCPEEDIYISSLQIAPAHRRGTMLRCLLAGAVGYLQGRPFRFVKTAVQKNNEPAIRMYRRLGFSFSKHPNSETSLLLAADRRVLDTALARRLSKNC